MVFTAKPPSHTAVIVALASLVSHPNTAPLWAGGLSARECAPWGGSGVGKSRVRGPGGQPCLGRHTGALVVEN